MPQLQINQGPQDALLYDNTRSYFTNVGYVRTSNFQTEYKYVDPQNQAQFGSTVTYVIPKTADLLGPVDLRVTIPKVKASALDTTSQEPKTRAFIQWVDDLGFAMVEKVTFSINGIDIESITGEQLQIKNELMTSDEMRLGFDHTLKTGRRAFKGKATGNAVALTSSPGVTVVGVGAADVAAVPVAYTQGVPVHEICGDAETRPINKDYTRLIAMSDRTGGAAAAVKQAGKRELIIPLGLFFTKHVSQYFPLAAIAGCNDIRLAVKFRAFDELVQFVQQGVRTVTDATKPETDTMAASIPETQMATKQSAIFEESNAITQARLFCHFVHVTGPEAQTLMNKEHVRLLKLWQHHPLTKAFTTGATTPTVEMDLSFLHPVSTLIITIRREDDMSSTKTGVNGAQKGFFFYHGDGTNPNYDRALANDGAPIPDSSEHTIKVKSIQLSLNGTERHPGIDAGIDTHYLQHRLLPALHSNSNAYQMQQLGSMDGSELEGTPEFQRYQLQGAKNIFVYPFSLNPEGSNPSGAVNFSKVSHAKLKLHVDQVGTNGIGSYRVDVYALYYNWLQIKDGRALLSFA